jgi:hypothetical protein
MPVHALANRIWSSASSALNRPLAGAVTIDIGANAAFARPVLRDRRRRTRHCGGRPRPTGRLTAATPGSCSPSWPTATSLPDVIAAALLKMSWYTAPNYHALLPLRLDIALTVELTAEDADSGI